MKVLVAGGAGYLGAVLCPFLAARGHHVTALDLAYSEAARRALSEASVECLTGDMTDREFLREALSGQEAAVNLAVVHHPQDKQDPARALLVNVEGARLLGDLAAGQGLAKLVYASACHVYGDPAENPITEATPCRPLSLRGIGKLAGETASLACHYNYGLDVTVLRLSNFYGPSPEMNWSPFVRRVVVMAVEGRPITVMGSGRQKRNLLHVADAALAISLALQAPGKAGRVFNIGGPDNLSVASMVEITVENAAKLGIAASIVSIPPRGQESYSEEYRLDWGEADRRLGYRPARDYRRAQMEMFDLLTRS